MMEDYNLESNVSGSTLQIWQVDALAHRACGNMSSWQLFQRRYSSVHGYVALVVCILGILANAANIVVLSRPKMKSPVNFLLMIQALADILLMMLYIPTAIYFYIVADNTLPTFYTMSAPAATYLYFYSALSTIFHSIALWQIIAVASFRWVMMSLKRGKEYYTMKNAYICSLVISLVNGLVSIPNWVATHIVKLNYTTCEGHNVQVITIENQYSLAMNNWLIAFCGKIVPGILLACLTTALLHILHNAEKKRRRLLVKGHREESKRHKEHNRTTAMLLIVVITFLAIELPHGIFIILIQSDSKLVEIYNSLGEVIDIVTLVTFSVNFFLYAAMSKRFRLTFVSLFWDKIAEHERARFNRLSQQISTVRTHIQRRLSASLNIKTDHDNTSFRSREIKDLAVSPLMNVTSEAGIKQELQVSNV